MSISERNKRFDISHDAESVVRPKIWVEGRQRPRFDFPAFAQTSLAIAKRDLAPEMVDAGARLTRLGQSVARGDVRVNVAWPGRFARAAPSHRRVGGWILNLATLFADARGLLSPSVATDSELAYPNLIRGVAAAVTGPVTPHIPTGPEPTLHAIRSAISNAPHDFGNEAIRQQFPHRTDGPDDAIGNDRETTVRFARLKQSCWIATCWALLGILLAFAIPVGAVRAMLYHLDGGDLRDWS